MTIDNKTYCLEVDCEGWPGCACMKKDFWVEYELKQLRKTQSDGVMPLIGTLLDGWQQLPNDLLEEIKEESPSLYKVFHSISKIMEGP